MARQSPSLDQQQAEFLQARFMAMPIAGALCWTGVGVGSLINPEMAWLILFIGTGAILHVGMALAHLTGEDLFGKQRNTPFFDRIFFLGVVEAVLVYAVAIPFFLVEPTSLPLTVGILTGLMWVPFSGLIHHWVGLFHAVFRTTGILAAWYLWPYARFTAIPAVVVVAYAFTLVVLYRRWQTHRYRDGRTLVV